MITLPRPHRWRSKKTLLIVGTILFTLMISSYVLWSRHVWAQYAPDYTQWHQDIKSDTKKVINMPVANEKDQDVLLARLESLSGRISSEQGVVCEVSALVSWQQRFVEEYRNAQAACQKITVNVMLFQKQLDVITAYIADDRKLAEISAAAVPPGEVADDAWGAQADLWGRVADDVNGLSVSEAFKPTRQVAAEKMTAIKVAWQELIAAHQLKDKAKYISAQNTLGASYDGLNVISLDNAKNLAALTNTLNDSYIKAFN